MIPGFDTFVRTIWGESRDQPWEGQVAVGWSIRNRVDADLHHDGKPDWWGEGYEAVCRKPGQFSCWNANDPNRPKLLAVTLDDRALVQCVLAARAVVTTFEPDPTKGATHYKVATLPWPKDWGPEKPPLVIIKDHAFYRLEG